MARESPPPRSASCCTPGHEATGSASTSSSSPASGASASGRRPSGSATSPGRAWVTVGPGSPATSSTWSSPAAMPPRRWSRSPTSSPRCASSSIPSTGASAASRGSSGDRDAGGWPMTARVVVAGTHSGVGKTTVATGLMGAFAERGRSVAGFKVGPDFIDPSYHALATGRPGRNLDAFLSGPDMVAPLFVHGAAGADLAIVEGVMGMFDVAARAGELASTAQVAKLLRAPVLLVVDCSALARSVAAVVHGFASFDPEVGVAGLIHNRVASDRHEELLRQALDPLGVPVVGVLRRHEALATPRRHLGLVPAAERQAAARRAVTELAVALTEACDLTAVAAVAAAAPALPAVPWDPAATASAPPTAAAGGAQCA